MQGHDLSTSTKIPLLHQNQHIKHIRPFSPHVILADGWSSHVLYESYISSAVIGTLEPLSISTISMCARCDKRKDLERPDRANKGQTNPTQLGRSANQSYIADGRHLAVV